MGGASTAAPIDAVGALYWNPATISGLKESELGFGNDMLFVDLDLGSSVTGVGSGSSESDSSVTPIPSIGWVQKLNETTTMGLGLGAVAGFSTNFPASMTSPIQAPQTLGGFGRIASSAEFLQVTPVLSLQLTECLAVAVGPVVTLGKLQVDPFVFAAPDNADGVGGATYPIGMGSRYHFGIGAQAGLYYTGLQDISNSRPKGPLGLKRDDEAIWGNLPKTRTNRRRIALPVVRSPALGDADVYEGRFGATLYLQAICGDRELLGSHGNLRLSEMQQDDGCA